MTNLILVVESILKTKLNCAIIINIMDNNANRVNNLIKRIQKGDEKAVDTLYVEFGTLFFAMAKKYLYDKSYAEDLLSEVFLYIYRNRAKSFDANFNGLNWIFTIIRHKAYKHNSGSYYNLPIVNINSTKMLQYVMSEELKSQKDMMDRIELIDSLKALSPYENELLYYTYWECLTIREIAKKLNKPRSTVHHDLKLSLDKLKKAMEK